MIPCRFFQPVNSPTPTRELRAPLPPRAYGAYVRRTSGVRQAYVTMVGRVGGDVVTTPRTFSRRSRARPGVVFAFSGDFSVFPALTVASRFFLSA